MTIRSFGIVGYGAFGKLLHTLVGRFAPDVDVRVFTSKQPPDGELFFTLADVAQCDAVALCVPIRAFEETVKKLIPLARAETVFVDISTVKVHTVRILKRLARGRRWIAMHPMWGPESYEKRGGQVTGLRIIICERTLANSEYTAVEKGLRGIGFDVVEMSAKDHDKHLAETLFLTHFIGQIVHRAGFDRTTIDTVSFGCLMDAVESVKHDTKLFKDVFDFNPYCKDVLKRFEISEEKVSELLEK